MNAPAIPASLDELKPGMELSGKVSRLELCGAFVDIGLEREALLHISQLGKADVRNLQDVQDAAPVGDEIKVYVLKVDKQKGLVALSLEKPPAFSWDTLEVGMMVSGTVVKLENFGAFVDIGAERPAMIHVSELTSGYVNSPSEVVKVGDEVTAKVIKVNPRKRQIDLSIKALEAQEIAAAAAEDDVEEGHVPTAMELALRNAMEGRGESGDVEKDARRAKRERRLREQQEREEILQRTLRHMESKS